MSVWIKEFSETLGRVSKWLIQILAACRLPCVLSERLHHRNISDYGSVGWR